MLDQLALAGLIPVIKVERAEDAVPLCRALSKGGLPVAEIKIDRSFVRGLEGPEPDRARALMRAILAMAGALGLRAIAEGVETEAQFSILKEEGCPAMQGFLLGRPLGLRSFEARYLAKEQRPRAIVLAALGGSGA